VSILAHLDRFSPLAKLMAQRYSPRAICVIQAVQFVPVSESIDGTYMCVPRYYQVLGRGGG
jgi:hypothetical protein